MNRAELADFVQERATEHFKAATKGDWSQVWNSFDQRQKAKAANDVPEAVEAEGGLFQSAGVAAE